MILETTTHVTEVKAFFEAPQGYFKRRQFDVDIRRATVSEMTAGRQLPEVLDVGCGNGSISIPLLASPDTGRLTLVDLSEAMLDLARASLTEEQRDRVRLMNADLMTAEVDRKFDLVICLGVLAHVDDPRALIGRLHELLAPGGRLILEVTDSFHPVGRLLNLYHRLLGLFRPVQYGLNRLRMRTVFDDCERAGLRRVTTYRYSLPPPGSQRLASHATLFRLTRRLFGTSLDNRRAWLGNIAIAEFTR